MVGQEQVVLGTLLRSPFVVQNGVEDLQVVLGLLHHLLASHHFGGRGRGDEVVDLLNYIGVQGLQVEVAWAWRLRFKMIITIIITIIMIITIILLLLIIIVLSYC